MSNYYDGPLQKGQDWGGDSSTGNIPASGKAVQKFIKDTLDSKAGLFDVVDTETGLKISIFSDQTNKDLYTSDPVLYEPLLIKEINIPTAPSSDGFVSVKVLQNFTAEEKAVGRANLGITSEVTAFDDAFELIYNSEGALESIRAKVGLWTNEYLSVRGKDDTGMSGGGLSWADLTTTGPEKIHDSHINIYSDGLSDGILLKSQADLLYSSSTGSGITEEQMWGFLAQTTTSDSKQINPSHLYEIVQRIVKFENAFGFTYSDAGALESIQAKVGLWTNEYLSVRGKDDTAISGGGGLTVEQMWEQLDGLPTTRIVGINRLPSIPWAKLTDVPLTFTPSSHTHSLSQITDLHYTWDSYLKKTVPSVFTGVDWSDIENKPSDFPTKVLLASDGPSISPAGTGLNSIKGLKIYRSYKLVGAGEYADLLVMNTGLYNGENIKALHFNKDDNSIYFSSTAATSNSWGTWYRVYTEANKPSPADIGALGTSDTAASALILKNTRKIFGINFNGSADVNGGAQFTSAIQVQSQSVSGANIIAWKQVASLFELDSSGDIMITGSRGLYSDSFISVRGKDDTAISGGGGGNQVLWNGSQQLSSSTSFTISNTLYGKSKPGVYILDGYVEYDNGEGIETITFRCFTPSTSSFTPPSYHTSIMVAVVIPKNDLSGEAEILKISFYANSTESSLSFRISEITSVLSNARIVRVSKDIASL